MRRSDLERSDGINVICLIITSFALIFGLTNVRIVEVPFIVKEIEIKTIEVPVIVKEIQVVEIPTIIESKVEVFINPSYELHDFPDLATLTAFLESDDTDKIEYNANFTCLDFALKLISNAALQGYRVVFVVQWSGNVNDTSHAYCMAYVRSEGLWIGFEPQTDEILFWWDDPALGKSESPS